MELEIITSGLDIVTHIFNLSSLEVKAGGQTVLWVQGQSDLRSGFQTSQGYIEKLCVPPPAPKKIKDKTIFSLICRTWIVIFMYVCVCLSVMKKEREWWKEKRGPREDWGGEERRPKYTCNKKAEVGSGNRRRARSGMCVRVWETKLNENKSIHIMS